ncbi:hypothetical protein [Micromonospora endolithica]|uniref:Uncharacterized protein n=1 Tax=Micromonospora endolithica TaxID=230091 RepID=A0A3A9ZBW4_9ACTN|nr:hypothetical protein [Micromonospora endolithica]RKN45384.1 hypothetical protein D7223_17405 [Micromonospora endolithica]TWJ22906.1 hypothetical protein JD76_03029 [Micromonospora endolithica]
MLDLAPALPARGGYRPGTCPRPIRPDGPVATVRWNRPPESTMLVMMEGELRTLDTGGFDSPYDFSLTGAGRADGAFVDATVYAALELRGERLSEEKAAPDYLADQLAMIDRLEYVLVVRPTGYLDPVPAFAHQPFRENADGSPVVPPAPGWVTLDLLVMDLDSRQLRCAFAVRAEPDFGFGTQRGVPLKVAVDRHLAFRAGDEINDALEGSACCDAVEIPLPRP